ncbi:MAG: hypothetical protein A2612_03660 [Candidatus Moranbacteria bacterium RIFOXYD1_FULL_44_12]|nr:MAG: hypothetical protein A2612_03660 [Candidatus Moranbacteria bacterium RIFOXYD1_FULL_44_12]
MKAIINTSTRRRSFSIVSITNSMLRHFVPLANKPLVHYPLESIAEAGIKEVAVVYNEGMEEVVKQNLADGSCFGLKITYIFQPNKLGNVDAILLAKDFVGEDKFLFYLGDNYLVGGINECVNYFDSSDLSAMVLKVTGRENKTGGVPVFDKNNRLTDYLEKPKNPPNEYAIPGLYFFDKTVFASFAEISPFEDGEYKMFQVVKSLLDKKKKVEVYDYSDRWFDMGKFDDWIPANQYLLDRNATLSVKSDLPKDVIISGRVIIGKDCKISNSEIRGPCIIGDGVIVKNSFVGSYSSIGDDCQINSSSMENSILMSKVVVEKVSSLIDQSIFGINTNLVSKNGDSLVYNFFLGNACKIKI